MARGRKSRKSGMNRKIWLLWGALALLLAVIIGFVVAQPGAVDSQFCPTDEEVGKTVLLLDVSDQLRASQRERLKSELENIGTRYLSKGERLVIYFIEAEEKEPSKVFDLCNPGSVQERRGVGQFFEGEIFAQRKWHLFSTGVLEAIESRISSSESIHTSPILEAVQYVRAKEFPPPRVMDGSVAYRIWLVSDMIQNSTIESHFDGLADVREVCNRLPAALEHVRVTVFLVASERYREHQTGEHVAWWRQFFSCAGGPEVLESWERF